MQRKYEGNPIMSDNYKDIRINCAVNTHDTVSNLIKSNIDAKIIDIPSGHGAFVLRLKDLGFNNITAIDIENILQIKHDKFLKGDMTKPLPIKDNSTDTLVCIDGIEHIDEQVMFIKEANRILKKNGELIISTPNISALRSRWRWFMSGHHNKCKAPLDENNPTPLHHIGMISFPELRYLLHTNGFTIKEVATNRIKPISWIFAIFIPFTFIYTFFSYKKSGKKGNTSKINSEIKHIMFSKSILFGETLIIRALKN